MDIILKEEYEKFVPADYKSVISCCSDIALADGINIYLIGGVVRDLILNNIFKDVDITVEYDAIEFAKLLEEKIDCKIISTQENLRTAKVEFANGVQIDFASTREEKYSSGGVLPVAYNFGCELEKDVKRRDFTINTLALGLLNKDKYKLIDYFNGYSDLNNKKIKILHAKSFIDDPSRIIRALKFMVRFGFELDTDTKKLMEEYLSDNSDLIPLERIKNELFQYFSIPKENLYKNIIDYKVYKLFGDNPITEFDEKKLKKFQDLKFIYFTFLVLNSNYEDERYNLTSKEKKILNEIKQLLTNNIPKDDFEIYKKYNEKQDLSLNIYYLITNDTTVLKYQKKLKDIKVEITGNDLINLGYKPSKIFIQIFDDILREKLKGKIKNKEEEIEFIKKMSR